ncbi:hypothetical protein ABKN59_002296 [Abortiporus biennis]
MSKNFKQLEHPISSSIPSTHHLQVRINWSKPPSVPCQSIYIVGIEYLDINFSDMKFCLLEREKIGANPATIDELVLFAAAGIPVISKHLPRHLHHC